MASESRRFLAPRAWVAGGWARDVLLVSDAQGHWSEVRPDGPEAGDAERLPGPVLPGLVDAHSHAFQRAIAGLTERSPAGQDDFWSWRDRMYAAALRISPAQVEAVAAHLYAELLAAGYTQVCEFHYLHNDTDGRPYADTSEVAQALARAAQGVGIGLTLLPALYMRAGFGERALREDQRRFASTPDSVLAIAERLHGMAPLVTSGVAIHSLRAADMVAISEVAAAARGRMPLHIHIAEQRREVEDCRACHGERPVAWLLRQQRVDERWNLVHATHTLPEEAIALRDTGAAVVVCPSTEANLGDGVFDLQTWLGASGRWSIGSDSHVTRSWCEELRLLEYSQRFALRERNVAARAALRESTAAALFEGALEGGSAAAGVPLGGLAVGQRADFMVLDANADALLGVPEDQLLDAQVFSAPEAKPLSVYVAGRLTQRADTRSAFLEAMRALWLT
ncbi:formimidoylglutamate deiminase [Ramlibacter sp. G-1-2-2]|uniref:Formimidoylglutamate deiminase n=1 Tax=Ramlibacter agri TaxID=2728837 RepID=A0A848H903_9BURK|nr:formimidoylglutamate deiminase [Ramlibacter agri]NML45989.1 formimidoylglutamate deiminase [Ramlibacter agri]